MKRKKPPIQHEKKPVKRAVLALSSEACFAVFASLSLVIALLLYSASIRVSRTAFVAPPAYNAHARLESNVRKVVSGFPIEVMAPFIAEHQKTTAAFLVAIAKKESNWGKHVPVDQNGADCFNYWGYRGAGSRGVEMGHGCFGSPEEAIDTVGKRIDTLVNEYHFHTPEELIVWKCGFSCAGHSNQSVKKWISDVKLYFNKVNN